MTLQRLALFSCLLAVAVASSAQQAPTAVTQDPTAVALVAKSLAVLGGGAPISDVTLTGTATRIVGSDAGTGTVTLKALGTSSSQMDLSLSNGMRSEIRTQTNSGPQGVWLAPGGTYNAMAMHNCLTDAAWFFPAFSVLSQLSNPYLSATYLGAETRGEESVQHLRFSFTIPAASLDPLGVYSKLTNEDLYIDSSSLLPVALVFTTHPDNNAFLNIPVEVDFSNYQAVSGVQVPFHIQVLRNGTVFLDVTIQNAILNSGLTASAFSAN